MHNSDDDKVEVSLSLADSENELLKYGENRHLLSDGPAAKSEASVGTSRGDESTARRVIAWTKLNWKLVVILIVGVLWSVVDKLLKKRTQDAFGTRYAWFQSQLANLFYCVIMLLICVIFRRKYVQWKLPLLLRFAAVGVLDGLKHFLESIGGPGTPGSWQTLFSGLNVVLTALASFLLLGKRMKWMQSLGLILVVLAGPSVILPQFFRGSLPPAVWYLTLIYVFHSFPDATSNVLKEKFFVQLDPDVFFLMAVSSSTEFVIGFAYAPLVYLKAFGGAKSVAEVIINGTLCFAGDSSIPIWRGEEQIGHCSGMTTLLVLLYAASHGFKNAVQVFTVKLGSALLVMAQEVIEIPVTNLAFSIPFIGDESFSYFDLLGLALVITGFILIARFGNEFQRLQRGNLFDEEESTIN